MKGFNPERSLLSQSETRLSESQEALYPLLVPENQKKAINMEGFRDLYDVDKDTAYVQKMEAEFATNDAKEGTTERSRKGGKLFESIINYGINDAGFLGGETSAIVASRYDDIANGIDSIVEFEDEGMTSHLALGIDVTRNSEDLTKKFDKIKESIDKGQLSSAKYFKSHNFRGELRHVVRVVVGADQPTIDNISDLMVRTMRLRKTIKESAKSPEQSSSSDHLKKELEKNSSAIEEHPLQWIVILEIQQQLEAARERAERQKQPSVVKECDKILGIMEDVIKEKKRKGSSVDEEILLNDRVYQLIQQEVKSF